MSGDWRASNDVLHPSIGEVHKTNPIVREAPHVN